MVKVILAKSKVVKGGQRNSLLLIISQFRYFLFFMKSPCLYEEREVSPTT